MVTKILDRLYLGDIHDAGKFDGTIICVMQELVEALEPEKAYWIPIIRSSGALNDKELILDQDPVITALPHQLVLVNRLATGSMKHGDVLIHCMAGIERSPLAVAFILHEKGMSWNDAYEFIQEKRPEVANRLVWLNMTYDERMS